MRREQMVAAFALVVDKWLHLVGKLEFLIYQLRAFCKASYQEMSINKYNQNT